MKTKRTLRRAVVPALAGLAVIGLAMGIIAFRLGSGPDAPAPPADTQAASQVEPEPAAPDAVAEAPQLPRRVVSNGYIVEQESASSMETLVEASDLIVVGSIVSAELVAKPVYAEIPVGCEGITPEPEDAGKECGDGMMTGMFGEYKTHYAFRVDRYLKTDGMNDDRELTVRQFGGVVDGEEIVVSPYPLYQTGRRYLLFLSRDSDQPSVIYTESANLGGFELNGGQVDRLPEAREFDGGAPFQLEVLTEQDAVTLVEGLADAEVAGCCLAAQDGQHAGHDLLRAGALERRQRDDRAHAEAVAAGCAAGEEALSLDIQIALHAGHHRGLSPYPTTS